MDESGVVSIRDCVKGDAEKSTDAALRTRSGRQWNFIVDKVENKAREDFAHVDNSSGPSRLPRSP